MKDLYEHISALTKEDPGRAILIDCDLHGPTLEISRAQLLQKVGEKMTALKQQHGVLLLDGENRSDFLITCWAAWCAGVTVVPLDRKRDTQELREYKAGAASTAEGEALILFTSGTTGRPKGARLTLQNLIVNAEGIISWLHIKKDDRFLVQLPLHHINSLTFCLSMLLSGGSIALPPRYSHSHFWELVAQTGTTLTSLVPTIIFDQLNRTKEFAAVKSRVQLSRIQLGSAPVVPSAVQEFMRTFSIPLYQGYGQTETALRVTGMPMDLPEELYQQLVEQNSIGTPMPWAEVQIADENGKILTEGEEGELIVKGPAIMRGYSGGETAFRDGYYLSGDVGYFKTIAGRRFFFLKGRSSELIIKGGVNISPVAVENALKKISPTIEQAYAVGVDDPRYGEEVGAAIVWKSDVEPERALRQLKLQLLSGSETLSAYETPAFLKTLSAIELPATSTGKVQRTLLKKQLAGKFEPVGSILTSAEFQFNIIGAQSPLFGISHELYNHCWQPLIQNADEYKKYLAEYITLGALARDGTLAGQIAFSHRDNKLTCVSICSAAFKPKSVPEVSTAPTIESVRNYLIEGHDPVMNFHQRLGAELVEVTPAGRPEDKSALGYTMLLRYPPADNLALGGPVSAQLIQAVRILASDSNAEVYAVSRPGGLAVYLSNKKA